MVPLRGNPVSKPQNVISGSISPTATIRQVISESNRCFSFIMAQKCLVSLFLPFGDCAVVLSYTRSLGSKSIAITWDQQKPMSVTRPFFGTVACDLTSIVDAESNIQIQRRVGRN